MHDLTAFTNRLTKTLRARRPWARRLGTDAYRLYEEDIPELRLIVDVYGDHAVVYDKSTAVSRDFGFDAAQLRLAVATPLGIPEAQVILKLRRRMPGDAQYQRLGGDGGRFLVREEQSRYLVNLTDYLDSGLFLDHRPLRQRLRRLAPGLRLLNLFCYTGSVSVAAAQSGARTTSVDLSHTYLEWARDNFRASGLDPDGHDFVRADCVAYLKTQGAARDFDVIFLDPPTFSNSKAMTGVLDVQRDHGRLVEGAMARLASGGVLYFSTNRQRFWLDERLSQLFAVADITNETIPEDFRNRTIHRCFTVRHR